MAAFAFGQAALPVTNQVSELDRAVAIARAELRDLESVTVQRLGLAWQSSQQRIIQELQQLLVKVEERTALGLPVSRSWLYRLDQLRGLTDQLNAELASLASDLGDEAMRAGQAAANMGATQLATQVEAALTASLPEGVAATIVRDINGLVVNGASFPVKAPSPKAINTLLARLDLERSPMGKKLVADFAEDAAKITQSLTDGILMGKNPRVIAREFNKGLDMPGYRAERIARTEVLEAYREGNRAQMQANDDLVEGWMWVSNTFSCCGSCLAMNGSNHPLDERLASHPNCRCQMVPLLPSWSELGIPGLDVLDDDGGSKKLLEDQRDLSVKAITQSSKQQLVKRFGGTKAELLKSGRVSLDEMSIKTESEVWGIGRREATADELLKSAGLKVRAGTSRDMRDRAAEAIAASRARGAGGRALPRARRVKGDIATTRRRT